MKNVGYIKIYTATAVSLFLLSPLMAFPYIIWGIYRQERSAYFLFSLFLGLLAWLQIPFADLFRHSITAYSYYEKSFSSIFENNLSSDYFIPIISWIFINNDIPYQLLRFLYVAESFFLMTVIFNYMIEKTNRAYTNTEIFIRFCILFFFFEFIKTTCGVRYGFALYQYIFALHLAFNKQSYLGALFFACLSSLIHISFAFFIPTSIILYLICTSLKKSAIIFFVFSFALLAVLSKYSYLLGRRADWYFVGGSSTSDNAINVITIYGFILFVAVRFFLLPYIIMAIKYFNRYSCWCRISIVWIGLSIVFITNLTILARTTFILSALGIFLLLEIESHSIIQQRLIRIILWCGIMTTLFNTVNYRTYIFNSRYQYIAMPIPIILQNQYSKQWIIEHVDGNNMKE